MNESSTIDYNEMTMQISTETIVPINRLSVCNDKLSKHLCTTWKWYYLDANSWLQLVSIEFYS